MKKEAYTMVIYFLDTWNIEIILVLAVKVEKLGKNFQIKSLEETGEHKDYPALSNTSDYN